MGYIDYLPIRKDLDCTPGGFPALLGGYTFLTWIRIRPLCMDGDALTFCEDTGTHKGMHTLGRGCQEPGGFDEDF
jgi:hypothetical protein